MHYNMLDGDGLPVVSRSGIPAVPTGSSHFYLLLVADLIEYLNLFPECLGVYRDGELISHPYVLCPLYLLLGRSCLGV